jgi:hypothetical protein
MKKARLIRLLLRMLLCLAALGLPLGGVARADSWAMPEVETTVSANGQYRFTVTPAEIGSQLDYFREEVKAEKSGKPVERPAPLGLLERRVAKDKWEPVWAGSLVNPVAPVTVLVADDGRHVVTFDNWHSLGHGAHVIVIYGPDGTLVRSLSLTDLVPEEYALALPHSVSSIYWSKGTALAEDGTSLVIPVVVPHGGSLGDDAVTVPFAIALADGAVTLPPPAQWEAALAAMSKVSAAMAEAKAELIAYLTHPLTPPQGCKEREWHAYLNEAFARLSPEPAFEGSTSTTVLLLRDHPRHRQSVEWLIEEVSETRDFPTNASFASPCDPDALVDGFAKAVKRVKRGAAANATFYIAAPEPHFAAIARLVAPTGAGTVWIDPATAIPQRPERIPASPKEKAAQDAVMDRMDAEFGID